MLDLPPVNSFGSNKIVLSDDDSEIYINFLYKSLYTFLGNCFQKE